MKRRIAALVVAAVTMTGLAAVPAQAASSGSGGGVSHPDIVLYTGQHNKTAKISYSVKKPTSAQIESCFDDQSYAEWGETYTGWGDFLWSTDVEYFDRYGNYLGGGAYRYSDAHAASGKVTSSRWYDWEGFGKYTARATVSRAFVVHGVDDEGWEWSHFCDLPDLTYSDSFTFKQATYLKVNASPEPVRKGKKVTVAGTLKYWDSDYHYGDGAKRALKGKTVKIYFDPQGAKGPTYKGSAKVTSKGTFSRKFKQTTSGTWIVKYAGTSTLTADRASDAVKVKK
ncbi:hypothetical protein ACNHYB_00620 [Isoptericola jiangsuensis]|uniref:hypothetical protein n=1 Tax=Isoptericola jiangsuensis TaxID=548579 RepID=UPI003AABE56E